MEISGGVWRGVEGCGGAWRGCGEGVKRFGGVGKVWRGLEVWGRCGGVWRCGEECGGVGRV